MQEAAVKNFTADTRKDCVKNYARAIAESIDDSEKDLKNHGLIYDKGVVYFG